MPVAAVRRHVLAPRVAHPQEHDARGVIERRLLLLGAGRYARRERPIARHVAHLVVVEEREVRAGIVGIGRAGGDCRISAVAVGIAVGGHVPRQRQWRACVQGALNPAEILARRGRRARLEARHAPRHFALPLIGIVARGDAQRVAERVKLRIGVSPREQHLQPVGRDHVGGRGARRAAVGEAPRAVRAERRGQLRAHGLAQPERAIELVPH